MKRWKCIDILGFYWKRLVTNIDWVTSLWTLSYLRLICSCRVDSHVCPIQSEYKIEKSKFHVQFRLMEAVKWFPKGQTISLAEEIIHIICKTKHCNLIWNLVVIKFCSVDNWFCKQAVWSMFSTMYRIQTCR